MSIKKPRKLGDVLLDLEPLFFEMVDAGLQKGDMLALVAVWIDVHAPNCIEVYDNGSGSPQFYYGPKLPQKS